MELAKKGHLSMWHDVKRASSSNQDSHKGFELSCDAKSAIREAFQKSISEELVAPFKTPVDNDSLAKIID